MCFIPFTISTSEVGVIERWGKFTRLAPPGLGFIICGVENLVGRMSYRVQQLDVRVETKTLDNVFITAVVTIQYQVLQEKVYEAFYALTDPQRQITAHVFDVLRAELPTLELDAVFEAKEELALTVKNALTEIMTKYGYQIMQVLITDLDPDQRVKNAMNQINFQETQIRRCGTCRGRQDSEGEICRGRSGSKVPEWSGCGKAKKGYCGWIEDLHCGLYGWYQGFYR